MYINVKDYGAVGDGVINTATAIASALTAAHNNVDYFPSYEIVCKTPIEPLYGHLISGT